MKTPFDYLTTTINGESLSNAYEIGFKAGIKEVVEWIEEHAEYYTCGECDNVYHLTSKGYRAWQSKLKEWGCL